MFDTGIPISCQGYRFTCSTGFDKSDKDICKFILRTYNYSNRYQAPINTSLFEKELCSCWLMRIYNQSRQNLLSFASFEIKHGANHMPPGITGGCVMIYKIL